MKRLLLIVLIGLLAACSTDCECGDDASSSPVEDVLESVDAGEDVTDVAPVELDLVQEQVEEDALDVPQVEPDLVYAELDATIDIPQVEPDLVQFELEVTVEPCGDGECDDDEDCASCPDDCGDCPPLVEWCQITGDQGDEVECELSLAAESDSSPKATQLQLDMNFDSTKLVFVETLCPGEVIDSCQEYQVLPTKHSIGTQEQSPGVVRLVLTNSGEPAAISEAYLQGDTVVGDPYVLDLVFSLADTIPADSPVAVSLTNMLGSDATASPLSAHQESDGLIVTAP